MEQREETPIIDDEDEPEPELPLAQRRSKRVSRPPGEWWKVRKPIPVVPDSDFEEDFGVFRAAGVGGNFLLGEEAKRAFFVGESWVMEGTKGSLRVL